MNGKAWSSKRPRANSLMPHCDWTGPITCPTSFFIRRRSYAKLIRAAMSSSPQRRNMIRKSSLRTAFTRNMAALIVSANDLASQTPAHRFQCFHDSCPPLRNLVVRECPFSGLKLRSQQNGVFSGGDRAATENFGWLETFEFRNIQRLYRRLYLVKAH